MLYTAEKKSWAGGAAKGALSVHGHRDKPGLVLISLVYLSTKEEENKLLHYMSTKSIVSHEFRIVIRSTR